MSDSEPPDDGEPTRHFPAPGPSGNDGWVLGNRYRITGRIGAGGMAEVFRAHDQLLNRDVAVKVFRTVAAGADTAAGAERQRAELHALARLNHPNLITLYDGSVAGPDDPDSRAYLVMELVEGPNLGTRIDTGPLPTEPEVRVIGAQIADALAYVHDQGMVHRDVKPANILLGAGVGTEQVRARLSDFGIVRLVGAERLTQADSTLGTASYLAPEQARGSGVGPPADIYALGLTLIEALTGMRSFDGPTPLEAVVARLDRDPDIPRNLPQPWPGLLAAMTARDPARRPTARQVADALRGGGIAGATTQFVPAVAGVTGATTVIPPTGGMPPVRPPRPVAESLPPRQPEPEPKRRNTGLIVGLISAAALIVLGVLIFVATSGGDDSGGTTDPTTSAPSTASTSSSSSSPSSQDETTESSSDEETPTRTRTRTSEEPSTSDEPSTSQQPTSTTPSRPSSSTTPSTSGTSQVGTKNGKAKAKPPRAPKQGGGGP